MKKLFKWLLVSIAALALGIGMLLYNPGLFKGPLEHYLGKLTGYSISLAGEVEISAGRKTTLTLTDLHVVSPDWAGDGELITVGYLNLVLDSRSLFESIVIIESVQIDDLIVSLEQNAEGVGNWVITKSTLQPLQPGADTDEPAVFFKELVLNNATVRYLNSETGATQELRIVSLDQQQDDNNMLDINLAGTLNGRPMEYTGSIGPFASLVAGRNIAFTGNGHFGSLNIRGNGLIDNLLEPGQPKFNIELQGPDIDEITAMLGVNDLGAGGFTLSARGETIDGRYGAGINGSIGDISLRVSAQASDLSRLEDVELKFAADGPSLGALTRAVGIKDWPDKPFSLAGKVQRVGATLNVSRLVFDIGGTQIMLDALLTNFPALDTSRVRFSLKGDDVAQFRELLGISGIATGPFEMDGKLDVSADGVELVRIGLKTSLGQATLAGTLGPGPSYLGTKLHMNLDGQDAHLVLSAAGIDALPQQPFSMNAHIEVVEKGLLIKRGGLVTIEDDRLKLGGLLALKAGGEGSRLNFRLSGGNLSEMLGRLVGGLEVPGHPYDLSGEILLGKGGIRLNNVKIEFAGIEVKTSGLVVPGDEFTGTTVDFRIEGDNLATLKNFPAIGDAVDIFVPGQPYRAAGRFAIEDTGWRLDNIDGRVGETNFAVDGLLSPQSEWTGSSLRFTIEGPGFLSLLKANDKLNLPPGAFNTRGMVAVTGDKLTISDFSFETANVQGKIDLQLGLPVTASNDINFDVSVWGDDVGHFIPRTEVFEPGRLAYNIKAAGLRKGDLISLRRFKASIGNLQISLQGKVDSDPGDENATIAFNASSEDISALGRLRGYPLPAMALDLRADFSGNASRFVLRNFTGKLGESRIAGNLDVSLQAPNPTINLVANSTYLDIRPIQVLLKPDEGTAPTDNQDYLIPAMPLPLDALAAADVTLKLAIDELRYRRDSIRNLDLEAVVQAGRLQVKRLDFEAPGGDIRSSLSIVPKDTKQADVKIDLSAKKFVLNIGGQPPETLSRAPAFDIEFHADGQGRDLRELAGSLNGSLTLESDGGILENVDLSMLDTFVFDEIFSLIMPKTDQTDDLVVSCAATIVKIVNGKMETSPALAFITDRISLVAKGSLDLKTEVMEFNFNAIPTNALQISAGELFNPFIVVGGTLSKPTVGLDPAKVLLRGGVAIGTAGVSILAKGLLDRLSNVDPVCEEIQKTIQQQ